MIPSWLSLIDVAFIAAALLFALGGFQKGFAGQVAHVITSVAFAIMLFFAYPSIYSYLGRIFRDLNETYIMWLIFAGLAALTIVFFMGVNKLLANVLKTQISDRSDRAYGFILGLVRGVLVALFVMIFLVILDSSGKTYDKFRAKSQVGKLVCYELVPRIQPRMSRAVLEERVNKLREALIYQEEAGVLE
jgi:uncharacterized membrane protein required for colicin V production